MEINLNLSTRNPLISKQFQPYPACYNLFQAEITMPNSGIITLVTIATMQLSTHFLTVSNAI